MINDIAENKLDYCLLALLCLSYILFFFRAQQSPAALFVATLFFGLSYVLWGIYHHLSTHTLHPKVVLEYCLVSIFAVILVSTLLI